MRRGFTLVEVLVALSITAIVSSLAYATLGAGLDAGDRLRRSRDQVEAEATVRGLLVDAFRHALPGSRGGDPVFQLHRGDRPSAARVQLLTRGVDTPLGGSPVWTVTLAATDSGLQVLAEPLEHGTSPLRALLRHVARMTVQVAPRGATDWRDAWPTVDQAPGAVALTFVGADGRVVGSPLVSRVAVEAHQ